MYEILRSKFGYEARLRGRLNIEVGLGLMSKPNLYFAMPKVASGTISEAVSSDTLVVPHHYRPHQVKTLLKLKPRAFKFTFVRHPFSRFSSAYQWVTQSTQQRHFNRIDARQQKVIRALDDINSFCSLLPDLLIDKDLLMVHFYPQSDFIWCGGKLLVDYVGKYESLEADCKVLSDQYDYGLNVAFGPNHKNKEKQQLDDPIDSLLRLGLSPSSIDTLAALYARDFELFEYHNQRRA